MSKKQTLGKGLSALIGAAEVPVMPAQATTDVAVLEKPQVTKKTTASKSKAKTIKTVKATTEEEVFSLGYTDLPVGKLIPGKYQPRGLFTDEELQELSASIKSNGVMQPIIARPASKKGSYEIVAGERRWRASKLAGLKQVPVIVREIPDNDVLELALVENIQRKDLTPIEEAVGYKRLIDEFGHTQEALSKTVGKSRSHIANLMRLLALPDVVKDMLNRGEISMGHARALIGCDRALEIADKVVSDGLNVRQVERLVKLGGIDNVVADKTYTVKQKDPEIMELEQLLTQSLGLRVSIKDTGNKGEVVIKYETLSELDGIIRRVSNTIG